MRKRNKKAGVLGAKDAKKGGNGLMLKALLGTIGIFVAGILVFFVADLVMPFRRGPMMAMMQNLQNVFLIGTLLSTVMLAFSLYLIYVYLKNYLELKNEVMLGLLLAVASFMMFALSSNPFFQFFFGSNPGVFTVIPLVFAAAALGALAWISAR